MFSISNDDDHGSQQQSIIVIVDRSVKKLNPPLIRAVAKTFTCSSSGRATRARATRAPGGGGVPKATGGGSGGQRRWRITFALRLKTTAAQQAGGWRTVLGDGTGLNAVVALSLKGPWVVV